MPQKIFRKIFFAIFQFLLISLSWSSQTQLVDAKTLAMFREQCLSGNRPACVFYLHNTPLRKSAYWKKVSPTERTGAAFADLIDYLKIENLKDGISSVPTLITPDPVLIRDVDLVRKRLQRRLGKYFQTPVLAVYLVRGLGSSGFCLAVFNNDDTFYKAAIVLDADRINQPANSWATEKEQSAFADGQSLSLKIETEDQNTRLGAIEFVLLHEFGHAISFAENLVVPDYRILNISSFNSAGYASSFWKFDEAGYHSPSDPAFPERKSIQFYRTTKLHLSSTDNVDVATVYRQLTLTPFPSLQASVDPDEDFADSFATYVHTTIFKKPYEITVHLGSLPALHIDSCWSAKRCQDRRVFLEGFLKSKIGKP